MQGLVEVVLGGGNVIVEFTGDGTPVGVDDAQGGVAGGDVWHDEAHGAHVAHQVERFPLLGHFFVNGVNVLGSAADFGVDVVLGEQLAEVFLDGFDLGFTVGAFFAELTGDFFVLFRVDVAKTEVFQFPLDLPDAETVGERRKNVEGLFGDALLLFLGDGM